MAYQDRYGDRYGNGDGYGDQTVPRDERAEYQQPPRPEQQHPWPGHQQLSAWQGQRPAPWPEQRPWPGQQPPGWQGQRPGPRPGQQTAWPGQMDPWPGRQPRPQSGGQPLPPSGGAIGNERLTAMTGAVLLVLLAAEGFTILGIRGMLTLHFFLGMLLIGPVALKAGSTIYRFARYYTGHPEYRRKGPPAPLLRLLGPVVLLLTAGVIGSGVMLAFAGPGSSTWLFLHKATFALWFCAMTVHVLAYVARIPRLLAAEARGIAYPEGDQGGGGRPVSQAVTVLGGRGVRLSLLIASLLAGLVIAVLTVHLANAWQLVLGAG